MILALFLVTLCYQLVTLMPALKPTVNLNGGRQTKIGVEAIIFIARVWSETPWEEVVDRLL